MSKKMHEASSKMMEKTGRSVYKGSHKQEPSQQQNNTQKQKPTVNQQNQHKKGQQQRNLTGNQKQRNLTGNQKQRNLTGNQKQRNLTGNQKQRNLTGNQQNQHQKGNQQQTQQTMDDHELIMQANNNLHKLYNFCDKKKIKIVTPAMVKETLVGIKALNQLKNRGGKSKYETLFTKYEKYIKCFIDECSKEQEIFSTGENQRELTELKNKFETLYDYRIL